MVMPAPPAVMVLPSIVRKEELPLKTWPSILYVDGDGVGMFLTRLTVLVSTIKFPSGSSLISVPEKVMPAPPEV